MWLFSNIQRMVYIKHVQVMVATPKARATPLHPRIVCFAKMGIERLLFVEEVPEDCVCAICQDILDDPKETLTCQHAFCDVCIIRWLQENNSCPTCRCPLSHNDLVVLHRIWREKLNRLKVKCHNWRVGCAAILELEHLDRHILECPFVRVNCPHSPCSEIIERSLLPAHLGACNYRKVTCKKCGIGIPAIGVTDHDCIAALREEMQRRIDIQKQEWMDCLRLMKRDHRRLEDRIQEQEIEISELKNTVSGFITRRKHQPTAYLPSIKVTGSSVRTSRPVPGHVTGYSHAHGSRDHRPSRRNSQATGASNNLSLPRLAPLHTHMSLSRNSGRYSGML